MISACSLLRSGSDTGLIDARSLSQHLPYHVATAQERLILLKTF